MNKEIVNTFIDLYYQNLNNKNYDSLCNHLKGSSTFVRDTIEWSGTSHIISSLKSNDFTFQPIKMNVLVNGDRRANVLVSGNIINAQNQVTIPFSEYILLSYSNNKEYWIHTSILHTFM